ncbi:MAG: hypothetical protein ACR2QE_12700 [Acidimicrobiales bacterium]
MTCRAVAAAMLVALLAALAVSIPADVSASAQVTITPDRVLVDGESVTIRGSGLSTGDWAGAVQCVWPAPEDLTEVLDRCDLAVARDGRVNQRGDVQFRMPARRFIQVQGQPVDCADPDLCSIALTTLAAGAPVTDPYTVTRAEPIVFDDSTGDPPLDLTVTVDDWDSRSVTATIGCSTPVSVRFVAELGQTRGQGRAAAGDVQKIDCVDEVTVTTLLVPQPVGGARPFRRLLAGPASLLVSVSGRDGRWSDSADDRRDVVIADPALTRQRTASNPGGAVIRFTGLRVTRNGAATIRAELQCDRNSFVHVEGAVVMEAPGGTYRIARSNPSAPRVRCDGSTSVALDLATASHRPEEPGSLDRHADILPPGKGEVHLSARSVPADTHSLVMRPIQTRRMIRPESVRVPHRPDSPLRIGTTSSSGVRGSLECARTQWLTVSATAGQQVGPLGQVVLQGSGATPIRCIVGHTIVFDIAWHRPIRDQHHTRIGLFAAEWNEPWQHTQGGWRRTAS